MSSGTRSPEVIAQTGDSIYERDVRPSLGPEHTGKVAAIDIDTGSYAIDEDALSASQRVREQHPDAEIWCVRVGRPYLHRIGRGFSSCKIRAC